MHPSLSTPSSSTSSHTTPPRHSSPTLPYPLSFYFVIVSGKIYIYMITYIYMCKYWWEFGILAYISYIQLVYELYIHTRNFILLIAHVYGYSLICTIIFIKIHMNIHLCIHTILFIIYTKKIKFLITNSIASQVNYHNYPKTLLIMV